MHELDIWLELYLNRCYNISPIGGKANKNSCTQAKCHEGMLENSFGQSFDYLHVNHRRSVSKIICAPYATKQGFRNSQTYLYPKKVQYIRYVDHFILAIIGDAKCAYDVLIFIARIVDSLGVKLSPEKFGVKSPIKGIVFLGYRIHSQCSFNVK